MVDRCAHPHFTSEVHVVQIADAGGLHMVDVRVTCSVCQRPLEFIGVSAGVAPDRPTTSFNRQQLRAPARFQPPTLDD